MSLPPETAPDLGAAGQPFDTTEVRWFAPGHLPESLVKWFIRSSHSTLEARDDAYLIDGSHDAGRKVRGRGSFEVKLRTGFGDLFHLGDRVKGRIEEWRKYVGLHIPAGQSWIEVGKVVLTRTYQPDVQGAVAEVRERDLLVPGCDIELASVSAAGERAWTFALEVWGPTEQRNLLLTEAAARFVADAGLPRSLTARLVHDMGYPEWLASLHEDGSAGPN